MADNVSLDLLAKELGRLHAQIAAQEKTLAAGPSAEKMQAAGDLAELKQRAASIRERLAQVKEADGDGLQDIKTGLDLELRDLADAFERWLDR